MEKTENNLRLDQWKPYVMSQMTQEEQIRMLNKRLLKRGENWYGFNYKGRFVCLKKSEFDGDLDEVYVNANELQKLCTRMTLSNAVNALKRLEIGDDLQTFNDYIAQIKREKQQYYQETHRLDRIERFITKIWPPKFERETCNCKEGTFDFIRVDVGIVTVWHRDRMDYIKENQQEITRRVISKIEQSKQFQKMGVPINFWQISSVTLTHDSILNYLFELKIK